MFNQEIVYFTLRRTYTDIYSLGLQVAYNTNTPQGVRKWLCSLIALYVPLVPPIRLPGVFQAITAQEPQLSQTTAMHDYILSTYTDTNI